MGGVGGVVEADVHHEIVDAVVFEGRVEFDPMPAGGWHGFLGGIDHRPAAGLPGVRAADIVLLRGVLHAHGEAPHRLAGRGGHIQGHRREPASRSRLGGCVDALAAGVVVVGGKGEVPGKGARAGGGVGQRVLRGDGGLAGESRDFIAVLVQRRDARGEGRAADDRLRQRIPAEPVQRTHRRRGEGPQRPRAGEAAETRDDTPLAGRLGIQARQFPGGVVDDAEEHGRAAGGVKIDLVGVWSAAAVRIV